MVLGVIWMFPEGIVDDAPQLRLDTRGQLLSALRGGVGPVFRVIDTLATWRTPGALGALRTSLRLEGRRR